MKRFLLVLYPWSFLADSRDNQYLHPCFFLPWSWSTDSTFGTPNVELNFGSDRGKAKRMESLPWWFLELVRYASIYLCFYLLWSFNKRKYWLDTFDCSTYSSELLLGSESVSNLLDHEKHSSPSEDSYWDNQRHGAFLTLRSGYRLSNLFALHFSNARG